MAAASIDAALADLPARLAQAVCYFWQTREKQGANQGATSKSRDLGNRTAVTGGAHCRQFAELVKEIIGACGVPGVRVYVGQSTELPGYFRVTKDWDVVVISKGRLVAIMEFKSQVGPSFGNNFNNRTEEALGNAVDLWTAFREGAFRPSERPWLGFFMLLEDSPGSRSPVRITSPHFKTFPEFNAASYAKRYEILCTRLVTERNYDAACLVLSPKVAGTSRGAFTEPSPELSFRVFAKSLAAHALTFATP